MDWSFKLWAAVLERAVNDATRGPDFAETRVLHEPERTRFVAATMEDAADWIRADSELHGSFLWVCAQLGLEPEGVRRRVAEMAFDANA